jgi:hypothetical protein
LAATRPYLAPRIVLATEPAREKVASAIMDGTVLGAASRRVRKSVPAMALAMYARVYALVILISREMRVRSGAAKMTALAMANATPSRWHVRAVSAGMVTTALRLGVWEHTEVAADTADVLKTGYLEANLSASARQAGLVKLAGRNVRTSAMEGARAAKTLLLAVPPNAIVKKVLQELFVNTNVRVSATGMDAVKLRNKSKIPVPRHAYQNLGAYAMLGLQVVIARSLCVQNFAQEMAFAVRTACVCVRKAGQVTPATLTTGDASKIATLKRATGSALPKKVPGQANQRSAYAIKVGAVRIVGRSCAIPSA